jgi:hypothetical protein
MFRTVFPSSSITLGAYANTRSMMRSSIISNSAIASEAQRKRIQAMGKRFGCHQCGSRQLLSKKVFIADHMPPTKRAEQLSSVWWRKLLRIKVPSLIIGPSGDGGMAKRCVTSRFVW